MLSSFTSENEHEKAKIHLLNVQQRRGDEKESKISEPDIQILPRKNLQNVEKDFFFLIFISAMCYSAVASPAWHLLNTHRI